MTIQEILKNNQLTEEQIKAILDQMKENKIYTSSEENLDIRYGKLKTDHEAITKQYSEAQSLIEELKKSSKNDETIQAKLTEYETKIADLTKQITTEKIASAIKVGLLSEKATDIDYLTYKLKEEGELELDEKEQIKGWNDKIGELKKKFPNQFENSTGGQIIPNNLNKGKNDNPLTRESLLKMSYAQRAEIYKKDPENFTKILNEKR